MFNKLFIYITVSILINLCATSVFATDPVTLPISEVPTSKTTPSPEDLVYPTLVTIPGFGQDIEGKRVVIISPNSLGEYLQVGFNYFIGVAILLAVVMIVYGGVLYATTEAVYGKSDAKETIVGAAQGLALALGSYLILVTINPDLIKFQLDIGTVELQKSGAGGKGRVQQLAGLEVLQNGVLSGGGSLSIPSNASTLSNRTIASRAALAVGLNDKQFLCQMTQEGQFVDHPTKSVNGQLVGGPAQIALATGKSGCPEYIKNDADLHNPQKAYACAAKLMSRYKSKWQRSYSFALVEYNGPSCNTMSKRSECSGKAYWQCPSTDNFNTPNGCGQPADYVNKIAGCSSRNAASIN